MAYQQGRLQRQGQAVHQIARPVFDAAQVAQVGGKRRHKTVQHRMRSPGLADLGKVGVHHGGCLGHGAQHVQALHIATALPDGVDRRLSVQARHHAVFHHAAAADAFHGLIGVGRRAFADPVLTHGRDQAHQQVFLGVGPVVHGAGHAQGEGHGGFAFQRQVRQHVLHEGLLDEHLAKSRAMRAVVQRLRGRHAHAGTRPDHAVKAGHADHLDDVAHATPLFAYQPGGSAPQFGLARRVGGIAHFFLEPQHLHRVFAAIRAPARHQKARQAARCLGQHQKGIAHGG